MSRVHRPRGPNRKAREEVEVEDEAPKLDPRRHLQGRWVEAPRIVPREGTAQRISEMIDRIFTPSADAESEAA